MTPKQALEWIIEDLGEHDADVTIQTLIKSPSLLETITISLYESRDPRRQNFRRAMRILIEEAKGLK